MQIKRYIYTNGRDFDYDYVRLAKKTRRLTFDSRFLNPNIDLYQGPKTPFREIRFALPRQIIDDKYRHLLASKTPYDSLSTLLKELKKALKRYFFEVIKDDNYLMFHSGGYDSRILSAALAECRDEGLNCDRVHFRCHPPECDVFERIMRCEGWKPSQYSCFIERGDNPYQIGHKEISVNGWASYVQQMNYWQDLGTDWTVIHGWCGEVFRFYVRYRLPKMVHCANRLLNSTIHRMIGREWEGQWKGIFHDVLSPYFSYYYLEAAMRADKRWIKLDSKDWHIDNIRPALMKIFKFPIDKIPRGEHDYHWGLTDEWKKKMEKEFTNSRFYRDHGHTIRKLNLFDDNMYMWDGRTWGFMTVYDKIV